MAEPNLGNRPLSPHLSVYRMTITMFTSIANRVSGAAMILASLMIVWWLLAAATSPAYFDFVNGFMTSWLGLLILFASLWALWFHFLAGIRHIVMDFGIGYGLGAAIKSAWGVLIGSAILTILSGILIANCGG
jgi:succinate dehydrogenase / fumarate reductase cytochrome b subunit